MDIEQIKSSIRNIPDFPQPGIQFKDITTLLMDPEIFSECIEIFYEEFKDCDIDVVVGIELNIRNNPKLFQLRLYNIYKKDLLLQDL